VELILSVARQLNLIVTDVAVSHEAMEYCHNNLEVYVPLAMPAAKQLNEIITLKTETLPKSRDLHVTDFPYKRTVDWTEG
jgi:hypothetical protein